MYLDPILLKDAESTFAAIDQLRDQLENYSLEHLQIKSGVYLWGSEEVARRMSTLLEELSIPIIGIFDSNPAKEGKSFLGHKIQLPRDIEAPVIICSYNQPSHLEEAKRLIGDQAIAAWELLVLSKSKRHLPWNNLRIPSDLDESEKKHLIQVGNRCSHDTVAEYWRQVAARHFVSILSTNQTGSYAIDNEYFVPGIAETTNESIFLDLGAYNGDTIRRFFAQSINGDDRRKAIALEADRFNYEHLLKMSTENPRVIPINAAVDKKSGIIPFSQIENSMGSSAIFFEPNTIVPAVTVDEIASHYEFTHVKFDIEGFERFALEGAKESISKGDALWSVASYHVHDDFWVIPSFFSTDYEMSVSRHAALPWDTTMHFNRKK
jgi:FkbM family methyltransferase